VLQFTIQNAGNTCYIDSILFSMFASTKLGAMLDSTPGQGEDVKKLRELILKFFFNPLKHCLYGQRSGTPAIHVTKAESVKQIRDMCRTLGWKNTEPESRQQDAVEFFEFLCETLQVPQITTKQFTFHGGNATQSDSEKDGSDRVLPLSLGDSEQKLLEKLLEKYLVDNIVPGLRRPVETGNPDQSCEVKDVDALLV
jgi:uncharacterized UBP type Zn finger protein